MIFDFRFSIFDCGHSRASRLAFSREGFPESTSHVVSRGTGIENRKSKIENSP